MLASSFLIGFNLVSWWSGSKGKTLTKSIISFEVDTKWKFSFAHLRRIETTDYVMKRKVNHEMKKVNLQIFFRRARRIRKKSHLSNVAFQRNHLSSFVRHLNQREARRIINCWNLIDKAINHRINYTFDEKTNSEVEFRDHFHFFVST
jgi:apolipoprotein N-acyltransferase